MTDLTNKILYIDRTSSDFDHSLSINDQKYIDQLIQSNEIIKTPFIWYNLEYVHKDIIQYLMDCGFFEKNINEMISKFYMRIFGYDVNLYQMSRTNQKLRQYVESTLITLENFIFEYHSNELRDIKINQLNIIYSSIHGTSQNMSTRFQRIMSLYPDASSIPFVDILNISDDVMLIYPQLGELKSNEMKKYAKMTDVHEISDLCNIMSKNIKAGMYISLNNNTIKNIQLVWNYMKVHKNLPSDVHLGYDIFWKLAKLGAYDLLEIILKKYKPKLNYYLPKIIERDGNTYYCFEPIIQSLLHFDNCVHSDLLYGIEECIKILIEYECPTNSLSYIIDKNTRTITSHNISDYTFYFNLHERWFYGFAESMNDVKKYVYNGRLQQLPFSPKYVPSLDKCQNNKEIYEFSKQFQNIIDKHQYYISEHDIDYVVEELKYVYDEYKKIFPNEKMFPYDASSLCTIFSFESFFESLNDEDE